MLEKVKRIVVWIIENIEYVLLAVAGFVLVVALGKNNRVQQKAREVKGKKGKVTQETEQELEQAEEDLEEVRSNREKREKEADELEDRLENHFDN